MCNVWVNLQVMCKCMFVYECKLSVIYMCMCEMNVCIHDVCVYMSAHIFMCVVYVYVCYMCMLCLMYEFMFMWHMCTSACNVWMHMCVLYMCGNTFGHVCIHICVYAWCMSGCVHMWYMRKNISLYVYVCVLVCGCMLCGYDEWV